MKTAEKFVAKLCREENKIYALIECHKLKAAYLAAVKIENIKLIELICEESKRQNDSRTVDLCEKFLASQKRH
jgi:hypothetical protein